MVAYGTVLLGGVGALKLVDLPHFISSHGRSIIRAAFTEALWYWMFYVVLLGLAYVTNPSDSDFRSFLTDLSFHRHLKRLHAKPEQTQGTGHVLTFSNRIAISLRTPPYTRRDFVFFSAVYMKSRNVSNHQTCSHPNACRSISGLEKGACKLHSHTIDFFFGAFGYWWAWGPFGFEGSLDCDRLSSSVFGMESFDDVEETKSTTDNDVSPSESDYVPSEGKLPIHRTTLRSANPKVMPRIVRPGAKNRSGQVAVPTTLSDLRARTKTATADATKSSKQPRAIPTKDRETEDYLSVHSHKHLPGLPFHVATNKSASNLATTPPNLNTSEHADQPAIKAKAPVDPVIHDLQTQYHDLKTSTRGVEDRLQAELEELRLRKREEDVTRADVRSRTRALEESKRQAEHEKLDAEKKLGAIKATRDGMLAKMEKTKRDMSKLEAKESELVSIVQQRIDASKVVEDELRSDLKLKTAHLVAVESKAASARERRAELQQRLETRKQELSRRRESSVMRRHRLTMGSSTLGGDVPTGFVDGAFASEGDSLWHEHPSPDRLDGPTFNAPPGWQGAMVRAPLERSTTPPSDPPNESMLKTSNASLGFLDHRRQQSSTFTLPETPFKVATRVSPGTSMFAPFASPAPITLPLDPSPELPTHATKAGTFYTEALDQRQALRLPDGPLSPMTPHQTSLIPAQLFDLLNHDGDSCAGSPTLTRRFAPGSNDALSTGLVTPRTGTINSVNTMTDMMTIHPAHRVNKCRRVPSSSYVSAEAFESPSPFISTAVLPNNYTNQFQNLGAAPLLDTSKVSRPSLNPGAKAFNFGATSTTPPGLASQIVNRDSNDFNYGRSNPFDSCLPMLPSSGPTSRSIFEAPTTTRNPGSMTSEVTFDPFNPTWSTRSRNFGPIGVSAFNGVNQQQQASWDVVPSVSEQRQVASSRMAALFSKEGGQDDGIRR